MTIRKILVEPDKFLRQKSKPVDIVDKDLQTLTKLIKKGGLIMIDLPNFNSVCHDMIRSFPMQSIRHLNACQRSSFTLKSLSFLTLSIPS